MIYPKGYELTDNGKIIEKNSSRLKCDNMIIKFFKKIFSYIYTFSPEACTSSPKGLKLASSQSDVCTISPVETEIKVGDDICNICNQYFI